MNAKEMWELYSENSGPGGEVYDEWAFGSDADKLADLVCKGIKTATSSAYALYEIEGESLPGVGEYSVILDSKGDAKCVIKTTKVYVAPFDMISETHAYKEGEGDKSLDYWREVHRDFFTSSLAEAGLAFTEQMDVVCEEFEVVYK